MSRTSTFFEAEAFLHPFDGREEILERYLDSLPANRLSVSRPITSAGDFLTHLNFCPPEEARVITSGMIEAWELASTDENHEHLLNVMRLAGVLDDYHRGLPAECLSLEVLTTSRELFESAITLDEVKKCDALELFRPRRPVSLVTDLDTAMNHFRAEIAARCQEKYGSRRVLVRRFTGSPVFMVGFFFEKSPKSLRLLDGDEASPNLARNELRPTQFDAVLFEPATGILSVRSGWGRLTDPIRRAFASAFLGDTDVYEWPGATNILDLAPLVDLRQEIEDIDGGHPIISELEYALTNDPEDARYRVNARDMRRVILRDQSGGRITAADVRRVVVKMAMQGSLRRRRVTLKIPNRIEFKRGSETARIIAQLHGWEVFKGPIASDVAA